MKKFAVFDIDGTLIRWQLYHALTDEMAALGYIDAAKYKTMRDARMMWKQRGSEFKVYEREVISSYDTVIKSLSFKQLDKAIDSVFREYKDQVYTYTRGLLASLKSDGYLLFAISGSQVEILARIAEYYGFDDYTGSVYERTARGFTGEKTVGARDKDISLRELVRKHETNFAASIGIGDSHSDIPMLELVDRPIAFNPESELFEHAKTKGWEIVVERKNMVYKLESTNGKYQLASAN